MKNQFLQKKTKEPAKKGSTKAVLCETLIHHKHPHLLKELKEFEKKSVEEQAAFLIDAYFLDDGATEKERDEEIENYKETLKKGAVAYKKVEADVGAVTLPKPNDCCILMQNTSGGACNLYSRLAAALQIPIYRTLLDKMMVAQDETYVYFKFPPPEILVNGEKYGVKRTDLKELRRAVAQTYKVKKEIHEGGLLPSRHPWVNLFSKAFFEFLKIAKVGSDDDYTIDSAFKEFLIDMLFGGVSKSAQAQMNVKSSCIFVESNDQSVDPGSCKEHLALLTDGKMVYVRGPKNKKVFNGKSRILSLGHGGHATSIYFKNGQWLFFDNQSGEHCKKCGDHTLAQGRLKYANRVVITKLAQKSIHESGSKKKNKKKKTDE